MSWALISGASIAKVSRDATERALLREIDGGGVGLRLEDYVAALDEEFAKNFGVADGSLEKMRSDVRANLEREVAQRLRNRVKSAVMEALPKIAKLDR